jgi:hypothetical protein
VGRDQGLSELDLSLQGTIGDRHRGLRDDNISHWLKISSRVKIHTFLEVPILGLVDVKMNLATNREQVVWDLGLVSDRSLRPLREISPSHFGHTLAPKTPFQGKTLLIPRQRSEGGNAYSPHFEKRRPFRSGMWEDTDESSKVATLGIQQIVWIISARLPTRRSPYYSSAHAN